MYSAYLRAASTVVPVVGGDQAVRHRSNAAATPPRRLRVGGYADRPRDVGRVAVAGLDEVVVVASGENMICLPCAASTTRRTWSQLGPA